MTTETIRIALQAAHDLAVAHSLGERRDLAALAECLLRAAEDVRDAIEGVA